MGKENFAIANFKTGGFLANFKAGGFLAAVYDRKSHIGEVVSITDKSHSGVSYEAGWWP